MNILEKVVVWSLQPRGSRPNYAEQGEVPIAINHILSISNQTNYSRGVKTTEFTYKKYPFTVTRPTTGTTIIEHKCEICNAPLKIKVQSKNTLMRIIKPSVITFCVSLIYLVFFGVLYGNRPLNQSIWGSISVLAIILLLLSVGILYFTLPMEYQKKGISDVIDTQTIGDRPAGYAKHGINQSPMK